MVNNYLIGFKYTAVKLYLKIESVRKVSLLLDCSKSSIQRWVEEYFETGEITPFLISNAHYLRHIGQILKFFSFSYFSVFSLSHLSHSSLYILIKG